jgi:indolepyruvate ferredoxin oxidoreductase beta subunit
MQLNLVIAGVGGQGILTIARILSVAALNRSLHLRQAEVHGMSQRGGAVYSHLRISDSEIFSDLIPDGQADLILAVEPLEALRYAGLLKPRGSIVASANADVNIGDYPEIEMVLARIAEYPASIALDTARLARAAGGVLSANVVALGIASSKLPFSAQELEAAIVDLFAAKGERVVQTNLRAFRFGKTAEALYTEALGRGNEPKMVREWISTLSAEELEDPEAFQEDVAGINQGLSSAEAYAAENLLLAAYESGRRQLFEHEVYRLIELVGAIAPPRHLFIPRGSGIDQETLERFPGSKIVLKLVSESIVHKSDAGAVRILPKELDVVRNAVADFANRFSGSAGSLLVEFVEHDAKSLGSELFVGIRATREFGPVIAAGLGGLGTEYLAQKFKPGEAVAKAVVLDSSPEAFFELFKRTVAYDVLSGQARGYERGISDDELLRCFRAMHAIAARFCIDRAEQGPDIGELEVNPFAFANGRMVPLDGRGQLKPAAKRRTPPASELIRAMIEPKKIAMIGVSGSAEGIGRIALQNTLKAGFSSSDIAIVKPGAQEIDSVRCGASFEDLPAVADLLVVATPAGAVQDVLDQAAASGNVRSAVVLAGGTDHLTLPEGMPVIGPNCMGIRCHVSRLDTFFIPPDKLPPTDFPARPIGLISQSGAFAVSLLCRCPHLNPLVCVSMGNQEGVCLSDLLLAMSTRDDVDVIGIYLEGFADMDGLETLQAIKACRERGKRIIFYKAGRSAAGREAASGHTMAIAGDYDICESALIAAGTCMVSTFAAFSEALELASTWSGDLGKGLFAITNAGMEAVAIADAATSADQLANLDEATLAELSAAIEQHGLHTLVQAKNPLDVTPACCERLYDAAMRAVLNDPHVGCALICCVPLAPGLSTLEDQLCQDEAFPAMAQRWREDFRKPIAFVLDAGPPFDALRSKLRRQGFPVFTHADSASAAILKLMR